MPFYCCTYRTFRGLYAVAPPGFCNRGEVRYGSIGGLEYEVPQSRLYWLCINVALCSTALQCICRVIRRSSMTMKAHTYYIIFGRPHIGGRKLPPLPPGGATVCMSRNETAIEMKCLSVCLFVCLSGGHSGEPTKTGEPIDTPFGSRLVWAKRTTCIRRGAHWHHLANTSERSVFAVAMRSCVKLL